MDCEDGSLRIKCYNRSTAITTQTSISAVERVCLIGTAHSSGWRLWYQILVCKYKNTYTVRDIHWAILYRVISCIAVAEPRGTITIAVLTLAQLYQCARCLACIRFQS
jgi:hypothetical protein